MSTTIHIPSPLRPYTAEQAVIEVEGTTVGDALAALTAAHPGIEHHLRNDDGTLRSFINLYVDAEDIRHLAGEATPVAGKELTLVPSLAGGAR